MIYVDIDGNKYIENRNKLITTDEIINIGDNTVTKIMMSGCTIRADKRILATGKCLIFVRGSDIDMSLTSEQITLIAMDKVRFVIRDDVGIGLIDITDKYMKIEYSKHCKLYSSETINKLIQSIELQEILGKVFDIEGSHYYLYKY